MNEINTILNELSSKIQNHSYTWLEDNKFLVSNGNDNGFENLVDSELSKMCINKDPMEFVYTGHFGHHFPDLDIEVNGKKYGVELKSKQDGTFNTIGNSIFESITSSDYKEILIFFGSRNKTKKTKYVCKFDKYRCSLSGVHVTHSPRFQISLNNNTSLFKTDQDYYNFRNDDEVYKSKWVRKILSKTANKNKWYVSEELRPEEWTNLDKDTKMNIVADMIINFPLDLFSKKATYSRSAKFLSDIYFVSSSNLRDVFSAGGKVKICNLGNDKFAHNLYTANSVKINILNYINSSDETYEEKCIKNWKSQDKNVDRLYEKKDSFKTKFIKVLNSKSKNYKNKNNLKLYDLITKIHINDFKI